MDRRLCPSYEAGFDACDPLGSVFEWSGRGPARVLRRRCRSEGIDRSPYEDVSVHRSAEGLPRQSKAQPIKSHFTLNTTNETHHLDRYHEYSLLAVENGDYIMAHDFRKKQIRDLNCYQPGKSKFHMKSPTRPLLVTTLSNTKIEERPLPRVEELFEKVEHNVLNIPITKQPLKSILNNPLPKAPQGILKKPKSKAYPEPKDITKTPEGRRRQRASSESDNFYANFHIGCPIPGYEGRFCNDMKRAKNNSGTVYSYGTAINAFNSLPKSPTRSAKSPTKTNAPKINHNCSPVREEVHLLRTTAINNTEPVEDSIEVVLPPRQEASAVSCPVVSPELPVSSVTPAQSPPAAKKLNKPLKKKPKLKSKVTTKMKSKVESRVESVDLKLEDIETKPLDAAVLDWTMDTEILLQEIQRIERLPSSTPSTSRKKEDHSQLPTPAPIQEEPPQEAILEKEKDKEKEKVKEKDYVKLNDVASNNPVLEKPVSKDPPLHLPEGLIGVLRPSLFPKVPPYLKFINHDETPCLKVPIPIQKHLKWKLTSITPIVVKKTLTNSGFRLVKSECDTSECPQEETVDWIGIWGKHMKSLTFRGIKDGQKMNHFPGTFQIGRKDRLWRNLQKLTTKYGVKEFGIMPKTYVLPHDLKLLKHDWEKHQENNEKWIIKPPASARGTGIKVVSRWTQIPKKRPVVVQRYVSKPYLINGSKFDMRLYVLVTSVHPLRIYLYKDGLARFASVKYNDEVNSLNDRYMHLTNYSINKLSKNYTPNEDFAACEGHKWTLQTLFTYLKHERNIDTDSLWESMKDLVIKTIISGEASISSLTKANVTSRYNCYELFGIDVLLDEELKPWLLEVNISPSLHSASPLDIHVKGPLVREVLNIAQFQIPNKINLETLTKEKPHRLGGLPYDHRLYTIYLSKEERDKHIIYTNMDERDMYLRDILSTLTPDDVRHLIQAEDEMTQVIDMERVFPNKHSYKYLNYLSGPRYYNRLFDAWETRYTDNRRAGIELLRNLCDIEYHLEVPPVPLKNDVDAPSPEVSAQPSVHSLPSEEPSPSASCLSATSRTCGDSIFQPAIPPPVVGLEPRA